MDLVMKSYECRNSHLDIAEISQKFANLKLKCCLDGLDVNWAVKLVIIIMHLIWTACE